MTPINYNHLYYFYIVASVGSIRKASVQLNLTPQTISGQITSFEAQIGASLFDRKGRGLHLSEKGRSIFSYAEEIFQLGDELNNILRSHKPAHWLTFTVGITDVIPKVLAHRLLIPVLNMVEPVRLICSEGDQDSLLADLAVNKLDLVLTEQPLQAGSYLKAFNHQLTESGFTFFASYTLATLCIEDFPRSMSGQPLLLQSKKAGVRLRLLSWFEKYGIVPNILAEFDDSALLKSFGQAGCGLFAGPTIIEDLIVSQYNVKIIGRTDEVKERYYAISPERRVTHPAILEIIKNVN